MIREARRGERGGIELGVERGKGRSKLLIAVSPFDETKKMKPFTFSVVDLLNLNSKVPPAMPYIPRYLAPDTVVLTSKTYQVQNRYQKGGNLTSIASYLVIYLHVL